MFCVRERRRRRNVLDSVFSMGICSFTVYTSFSLPLSTLGYLSRLLGLVQFSVLYSGVQLTVYSVQVVQKDKQMLKLLCMYEYLWLWVCMCFWRFCFTTQSFQFPFLHFNFQWYIGMRHRASCIVRRAQYHLNKLFGHSPSRIQICGLSIVGFPHIENWRSTINVHLGKTSDTK